MRKKEIIRRELKKRKINIFTGKIFDVHGVNATNRSSIFPILIQSGEITKLFHGVYVNNLIDERTIWERIKEEEKGIANSSVFHELLDEIYDEWTFSSEFVKTNMLDTKHKKTLPSIYVRANNYSKDSKDEKIFENLGVRVIREFQKEIKISYSPWLEMLTEILIEFGWPKTHYVIERMNKLISIDEILDYGIKTNKIKAKDIRRYYLG